MKKTMFAAAMLLAPMMAFGSTGAQPVIQGDYLEVRSCDVYTGACFANGQWGQEGKEAVMVWSVREGDWRGVALDGLSVILVLKTQNTLANVHQQPERGKALIIVDEKGNKSQREALRDLAETQASELIEEVVAERISEITSAIGTCSKLGCAFVKAGELVEINTRCLGGDDHVCGNEYAYYPPLTEVQGAYPVFTKLSKFTDNALDRTWEDVDERSGYLAKFSR